MTLTTAFSPLSKRLKRAFSLIEMAVVMGIIALALGAIWLGASTAMENMKIKRTTEAITYSVDQMLQLYPNWAIETIIPTDNTFSTITSTAIKAGVITPDWVTGSTAKHPWGGTVDIVLGRQGDGLVQFVLKPPLSQSVCTKLVANVSAAYRDRATLSMIAIAGTPTTIFSTFPITPDAATTACAASPFTYLAFYFKASNR